MAENKSENISQNHNNQRDNLLFLGIGIGVILLVLAEIGCILAQIYYMLSSAGSIVVLIISALLLLGITGACIFVLKNALFKRMDEQKRQYEEMLRINKATYMKAKRISGQSGEDDADMGGTAGESTDRIREDMERMLKEQGEELYKRQMAVANVQIKRTRESVMNMVRANEYIIEVMEEKLGADSAFASHGAAIEELQESVAQLRILCEKMAGDNVMAELETESEILPETDDFVLESEETLLETEDFMSEMIFETEDEESEPEIDEIQMEDLEEEEPAGVDIEPLPEEILENIDLPDLSVPESEDLLPDMDDIEPEEEEILPDLDDMELEEEEVLPDLDDMELEEEEVLPDLDALLPEVEDLLVELDEPEIEEAEPEPTEEDSNRPMTPEEIEALLNNL